MEINKEFIDELENVISGAFDSVANITRDDNNIPDPYVVPFHFGAITALEFLRRTEEEGELPSNSDALVLAMKAYVAADDITNKLVKERIVSHIGDETFEKLEEDAIATMRSAMAEEDDNA